MANSPDASTGIPLFSRAASFIRSAIAARINCGSAAAYSGRIASIGIPAACVVAAAITPALSSQTDSRPQTTLRIEYRVSLIFLPAHQIVSCPETSIETSASGRSAGNCASRAGRPCVFQYRSIIIWTEKGAYPSTVKNRSGNRFPSATKCASTLKGR